MSAQSRQPERRVGIALAITALVCIPLTACSNSSSSGKKKDSTAPVATATPGTMTFATPISVSLAATDNRDPSPTIHYTTDASVPTLASAVYTAPITVNQTTVLKFFAVDARGNASPIEVRGYTEVNNTIEMEWAASGHGNILGEPFRHWDEDGVVSTSCARCHGDGGFQDYVEDGVVDNPAPLPLGHYCITCHAPPPFTRWDDLVAHPELNQVEFPSMETASLTGSSNMCTTCHQGRSSKVQVDAAILANPGGPYRFINIHYFAAAATYFGAETKGGYEYAGKTYVGRTAFPSHPEEQQTCVGCHMDGANKNHTFEPQVATCNGCHTGATFETLSGSPSANHAAIQATLAQLQTEIRNYGLINLGVGVVYEGNTYPYFFGDTNGNGIADPSEATRSNGFSEFDETLLKAAYNFQVVQKDPAGFVHNGTYVRQLLFDSITDLGGIPTDIAPGRPGFDRDNASKSEQWHLSGHADSLGEPFRHWDDDVPAEVSEACARCHTSPGFIDYVDNGVVDAPARLNTMVECQACHNANNLYADPSTRYTDLVTNAALEPVAFPSGATGTFGDASNICMTCHQGRESGVSVDANMANMVVQSPTDYPSFDFVNRHYYAAGAILFGSDVTAAYEYAGAPAYAGMNVFNSQHDSLELSTCVGCHMRRIQDHNFVPELSDCTTCHQGITDFAQLGLPFAMMNVDYDGDMVSESFQDEIDGMAANLYMEIQNYARTGLPQASPVVYSPTSYPYWFKDSDNDGMVSPGEASFSNRYQDFDRTLLRAAFNYHAGQDPASDIHNYKYVLQTLFDSADDLDDGVINASALGTRP